MFEHPITLFIYVFANLSIALACFCCASVLAPRSHASGFIALLGGRIFFIALGVLMIDVTLMALFSDETSRTIEAAWHAMTLRVIAAAGMVLFAGGLYVDATRWYVPGWTAWRAHRRPPTLGEDRSERVDPQ